MQLGQALARAIDFYQYLIVIFVLLSWFPVRGFFAQVQQVLASICEPYLALFRRFVPVAGGLDFSPFIAIIVLQLLARFIVQIL